MSNLKKKILTVLVGLLILIQYIFSWISKDEFQKGTTRVVFLLIAYFIVAGTLVFFGFLNTTRQFIGYIKANPKRFLGLVSITIIGLIVVLVMTYIFLRSQGVDPLKQ